MKETNYLDTRAKICQLFASEYTRCAYLLEGNCLTEQEKETFRRKSIDMNHKKVIILLDEYDTLMQEAYVYGYWEELTAFTRSMFNATFKTNPYLERTIMTGIMRVSKESIFSDLNNLKVVTITSDEYGTAFGFTEEEVFAAMDEFGLDEKKESHDLLGKHQFQWFGGKLIGEGTPDVKMTMEDLQQGKMFHTMIDEQIVFSQLNHKASAIWSLLLASAYLRVEHMEYNERRDKIEYDLKLTNKEARIMFGQMIDGWFLDYTADYNVFIKALLQDNKKAMNTYMNRVALTTFSNFDTGRKPSEQAEPERFLQV